MRKALLPALVPAKRVAERAAAVAPVARQCGCALGAAGLAAWEGGGAGALTRRRGGIYYALLDKIFASDGLISHVFIHMMW